MVLSQKCFFSLLQTFALWQLRLFISLWVLGIWIKKAGSSCHIVWFKNKSEHLITYVIAATSKPIIPSWLPLVTNFIMKAFINGRKLFGTPFYPVPGSEVVRPSWLNNNKVVQKIQNLNAVWICLHYVLFLLCSAAGLLLWLEGVDRRRVGAQRQMLQDLREDRTLHEGLPEETQVGPSWFIRTFLSVNYRYICNVVKMRNEKVKVTQWC